MGLYLQHSVIGKHRKRRFFDRTFTPVNEDLERVRQDNARCIELLNQWRSQFPENYSNPNLKLFRKGEGLTEEAPNRGIGSRVFC